MSFRVKRTKQGVCPACEEERSIEVGTRRETLSVRNEPIAFEAVVERCATCGEFFANEDEEEANFQQAYRIYRERHGLLQPQEIRAIRERYGIGQRPLSRLLGWGEVTIHRYESGAIQDEVHNEVLLFLKDPENFRTLFEKNKDRLPPHLRKRILSRLSEFRGEEHGADAAMTTSQYERALIRNLNEIGAAIFERRALVGLEKAQSAHAWDFFRVAYNALFNDMIAHCMRVLDRNSQSASFWYLYRYERNAIDLFVAQSRIDWPLIEAMTDKLKLVRDKTHFHVDRNAVFSPGSVWKATDIKDTRLAKCVDNLWKILEFLHVRHFGKPFYVPSYDGKDATLIVQAAQEAGIISH